MVKQKTDDMKELRERLNQINEEFDNLTNSLIEDEGCSSAVFRQILEQKSKYFRLWLDM